MKKENEMNRMEWKEIMVNNDFMNPTVLLFAEEGVE